MRGVTSIGCESRYAAHACKEMQGKCKQAIFQDMQHTLPYTFARLRLNSRHTVVVIQLFSQHQCWR